MRISMSKLAAVTIFMTALCAATLSEPHPAAAEVAKCPCTPAAQPNFPTYEPEEPAAIASEMWAFMWRIMHNW